MQFLYAIINFLILGAILYIFGRKMVANIFNSRRDRINAGLDEAEAPLELPEEPEEPEPQPIPQPVLVPDDNLKEALAALEARKQRQLKELEEQFQQDSADLQREMLLEVRDQLTEKLKTKAAENLASDAFISKLRHHEQRLVDDILQRIQLTPGDHSYLTRKDVLYVTLTSAYPLDQELVDRIQQKATQLVESAGGKASFWYKQDSSLIGGFQLRIGDTIYDCSMNNHIYHLAKAIGQGKIESADPYALLRDMEKTIQDTDLEVDVFQVGRVISVSDGICWLDGLADIMFGEVVEFECGERGMVLDIEPDKVGAIIYGRYEHIESYSRVRRLGFMASVPVGKAMLGRVVDPLGSPIDGQGKIWTDETRPIEASAPAIPDRQAVDTPLHTGIKAIDALVPIGRGQRELIIGDRQTGKTSIAIDAIINQKGKDVACVYVAIGQKEASVSEIVAKLEACGAMDYTTVVCATASDSASLQYIAPFAGAAIAEYFMYNGQDALVIYDDLSKHAVAYRELSLLLHRPSGREAYPGDIFYLHSRLLERAARLSDSLGGGSVTALPIIETQSGDISAYIPTNVISITDGQIFLETDLFNQGQRPAVNVGLSVSRVGSAAQTKLMKQFSSQLRTNLAQYRELESFTQFGSDVDESTKRVLAAGQRMMAALRQERFRPLDDWQQVLLIYAVSHGYADGIDPADMEEFADKLYDWFGLHFAYLVQELATGHKLGSEVAIKAALDAFVQQL